MNMLKSVFSSKSESSASPAPKVAPIASGLDLSKLPEAKQDGPIIALITGEPGAGKTTLAGKFPEAVVLPVEDGTRVLAGTEARLLPKPKRMQDVRESMAAILNQDHNFKTLVIDSISALDCHG